MLGHGADFLPSRFLQAAEHESLTGLWTKEEDHKSSYCCASLSASSSAVATQESMAFALQTSIYMDSLCVEDQMVQVFYQQVSQTFLPLRRLDCSSCFLG